MSMSKTKQEITADTAVENNQSLRTLLVLYAGVFLYSMVVFLCIVISGSGATVQDVVRTGTESTLVKALVVLPVAAGILSCYKKSLVGVAYSIVTMFLHVHIHDILPPVLDALMRRFGG